ncbi:MAG: E3 binding domain-containing protein, partial [Emcibacter sp.]|nr:E3 binding domain-containing protein [Emcibacter sp.]
MGKYYFKLPDLGEGIVEAEVVAVHVKLGEMVTEDQPLIDMMTDKATVEIPSPVDGKILSISGNPGEMIAVGSDMVIFEVEGVGNADDEPVKELAKVTQDAAELVEENVVVKKPEPVKAKAAMRPLVQAAVTTPDLQDLSGSANDKPLASPSVRRQALDENIDLAHVPGSGPAGRISHRDVDDFIAAGGR